MKYKFVHILGASGSGTTTLGKKIASKYNYTHLDSDDYYWNNHSSTIPFTNARKPEERIELLKKDIAKYNNIVLSGAVCNWGDELKDLFDLVIFLNISTETRVKRIKEREINRFGDRILPGGDMYDQHQDFIEWARIYDNGDENVRSYKLHSNWIKDLKCPVITINEGDSVDEVLDRIFS